MGQVEQDVEVLNEESNRVGGDLDVAIDTLGCTW